VFCPKCGSEYRAGFQECADCAVPLVESVPASSQPGHHDVQLATVFASGDPALIALARSLLDAAEIPFTTKGEGIQDLFGWGRMPGSYSVVAGPVEFQVNEEDVADARALLEDLHESNQDSVEIDSEPEDDVYKPLGSTTCPACGMPYNLSDYRADAPKIFCSHCRTELPRTRPISLTDDWPVVREGVWLYAGTTPVAVRILLSSETCGTGDYEDEESAQQNQDVECYFLAYEMPGAPGNFCNQVWDFVTVESAVAYAEEKFPGIQWCSPKQRARGCV